MYILDTDIVIWILRAHPAMTQFLARVAEKNTIGVSAITVAEVYQNIFPAELNIAEDFFSLHNVIPVAFDIAKEAGLYWQQYHRKLGQLTITDCLIASTAKMEGAILYTLNLRHFPMADIRVCQPRRVV